MPAINVLVQRAPANQEAEEITDVLCTTEEAAVARGRAFIDEHYKDRLIISGKGPLFNCIEPGIKALIQDREIPDYYADIVGVAISISISDNSVNADIDLTMEQVI